MNDTTEPDTRRWWSKALLVGGVIALVALPLGALGTRFGIWPFMGGFMVLAVGVVLATIVFFLGIIGGVYAHTKALAGDRNASLIGFILGVIVLGVMIGPFMKAFSVPPIHNISTDTNDPPQFDALVAVREAENANPLAYNAEELAPQQQAAYPFVKPLISGRSPAEMFTKAEAALADLGFDVVNTNAQTGLIEATDTTFWFGFKDDIAVRIRGDAGGSVVDIRSVSRVGQSDLGKNAERIAAILNQLQDG